MQVAQQLLATLGPRLGQRLGAPKDHLDGDARTLAATSRHETGGHHG
jgi:hypothetical protein